MSSVPIDNITGGSASSANFVDLTTDQTISGTKTFGESPILPPAGAIFNSGTALSTLTFAGSSNVNTNLPTASGNLLTDGGNITLGSGNFLSSTASASPSSCNYQVISAGNGLRSDSAGVVRLCTNSADRLIVTTSAIQLGLQARFNSGTVTAPGITWSSDTGTNSGWYLIANDTIGTAINGVNVKTLTSSSETVSVQVNAPTFGVSNGGFVSALSGTLTGNRALTVPDSSGTVALVSQIPTNSSYVDLTTSQAISGTKSFNTSPVMQNGSAIWNSGSALNTVSFTGLSTVNNVLPTTSGNLLNDGGNITLPTGNFQSTTATTPAACNYQLLAANSGIYSSAASTIRVASAGVDKLIVSTGSIQNLVQNRQFSGTVSAPGISWVSDTTQNSGWYRIANQVYGFSVNGVQTEQHDNSGFKAVFFRPVSGTQLTTVPSADSAAGTMTLLISPTSGTWSAGGIAQVYFGDLNHRITCTNASGMVISDSDSIRLGANGTGFQNIQHGSVAYSTPLGNNASVNVAITFASAFSSAPTKVITSIVQTTGTNWDLTVNNSNSVTTTGFNFAIRSVGGATTGSCNLCYIAIQ